MLVRICNVFGMGDQPKLVPLYASGLFKVDMLNGITSLIEYVYHDVECYYYGLSDNYDEMVKESLVFKNSFQEFLDEEEVYLNNTRVKGKCLHVEIMAPSCSPVSVYFYNLIGGKIRRGVNIYKNIYPSEQTLYPYFFLWWFPRNTIIKRVEFCGGRITVSNNFIIGKVKAGERACGKEEIEFHLK